MAAHPFQSKKSRREENLNGLLTEDITGNKSFWRKLSAFLRARYKIVLVVIWALISFSVHVYFYNRLTIMRQDVNNMKSQIESALQMRQNLVPALTTVVYQFIQHENNIFLKAVESREDSLLKTEDMTRVMDKLKGLIGKDFSPGALSKLIAVAENYPKLVTSESYQLLISQISGVENQIFERRIEYNDTVNRYNTLLSLFPINMIGRTSGFRRAPYFAWQENKAEWSFTYAREEGEMPVSMQTAE